MKIFKGLFLSVAIAFSGLAMATPAFAAQNFSCAD